MRTAQPPTIPFWLGEGLGRTDELSNSVGRLNDTLAELLDEADAPAAVAWLRETLALDESAAEQLVDVPRGREGRARRVAEHEARDLRAVLRRDRRHASRDPFAVRLAREPRVGARAAQALLPPLQLRAAGRGARGLDRDLARRRAQLRARRGRSLPHEQHDPRRAHAGGARRAGVRRRIGAGTPRSRSRCGVFATARRRPRSSSGWTPRTCSRPCSRISSRAPRTCPAAIARSRITRSSRRRSTTASRARWTSTAPRDCSRGSSPARSRCCAASSRARRRSRKRFSARSRTRSWTTRPRRSAGRSPCRRAAS